MSSYVRALYDFTGEPNTSELSIVTGEVLSVTRTDVGEGWWEGKNSKGQTGLFPAAYVEVLSAAEVQQQINGGVTSPTTGTVTSNVVTTSQQQQQQQARYDQTADDWNDGQDDWDDDWDDDNDTYSEIGPSTGAIQNNNNFTRQQQQLGNFSTLQQQQNNYANMNLPPTPSDDNQSLASVNAPTTVKRAGMFSRSGDSYILGTVTVPVPDNEKVNIIQVDSTYFWQPITQTYTVKVASPKKETKFKGMKSFIAYQLTPSFNNISVSRRYKHFDWLHNRFQEKFGLVAIPPLPDKQIQGRYEEQFIEHRLIQLQEFVDWVCRHPVLSQCQVWMHFLTCTDEKKWKVGKRQAEKDPLVGMNYCLAICPPEKQLLQSYVDGQIENYTLFVHSMDNAVKKLLQIADEQIKRTQIQARKDFQRIGEGFAELAKSLEIDERRYQTQEILSISVGRTSGVFINIGKLFGEQGKNDWQPFGDTLHIYR